jgi:hypothetical protein
MNPICNGSPFSTIFGKPFSLFFICRNKSFAQTQPAPHRRADFHHPAEGPPGVNLRRRQPRKPFNFHAAPLSRRDARACHVAEILHEKFSVLPQNIIVIHKNPAHLR